MAAQKPLRVLNIEDSKQDSYLLQHHLSKAGYDLIFECVDTPVGMRSALGTKEWDVILADYSMPEFSALEALALLQEMGLDIPFIIISGTIGEDVAVQAMLAGASDYLVKNSLARLTAAIERELEEANTRRANRLAEEELARLGREIHQQRDRLNTIIASVPGVVWEAWGRQDADAQRTDFASDYVETMLGYTVQEWLSKTNFWFSIVHPDDKERVGREAAANFAANKGSTQEFRWVAKNGDVLWVEAKYVVIGDDQGRPIGMRGVTIDISERRRAELALRDSEERYRQLFESNPDPIFVFDQQTLQLIAVNEAAVKEYGYSREELLSLTGADIWPPEERPDFIRRLAELPDGPPKGTTWKHQKKDGAIIEVEITRRPLVFSGKPTWVMLAHNVTARAILEAQLRQAQKMEAVGQLAGGIAHDFNNILTVIIGYCEIALSQLQAEDPMWRDLDQIKQAGTRAAALTRQLLAFSRKQVLLPKVLDLNALISELEKMLLRLIGEDIALHTDLESGICPIKADRGHIEQVIVNLVVNARDAMPAGGKLTIETHSIKLTESNIGQYGGLNPGSYVVLAVTDTGVGMDDRTLAQIFDPFFTTKEASNGTGLGLSTVFGIVQQSGGSIRVYSAVGQGATFEIYLPLMAEEPQPEEKTKATVVNLKGTETIVLVEDDDMVRSLASGLLSTHGYRVLEAANGAGAISICERNSDPVHLLITDIVLPGMNGCDLADQLVKLRPQMKVLFMSGYTDRTIVNQQVFDEKIAFIQKPFAPIDFVTKIRETLGN